MNILSMKYGNQEGTTLRVTHDGGECSVPWPCHTWHGEHIQQALGNGMAIAPCMTPEELAAKTAAETAAAAKAARDAAVAAITVEVAGKVFDGDEVAQTRMARAIQVAEITGLTSTNWKLADNSMVTVTLDELKQALALAMQAQGALWV